MSVYAHFPVSGDDSVQAVREFLRGLLLEEVVEAVLVPAEIGRGGATQPALIADPARMDIANPLFPTLPINGACMVSLVAAKYPAPPEEGIQKRIAVVVRPCELRAVIELSKFQQIDLDRILTVGIDCVGTYEVSDLQNGRGESIERLRGVLRSARSAEPEPMGEHPYREACSICETPVPWNADIALHVIGVEDGILVEAQDRALMESLDLSPGADHSSHRESVDIFITHRRKRRKAVLDAFAAQMHANGSGIPGLMEAFELCQRCHNCTVVCPICYCKECLFRSDTFAHDPSRYMGWAKRKGATRLPGDTIAFHLTRLIHVSTSCVGCGLCSSACPADLPVDLLFQTVARRTQRLFDYVPGRDRDETVPVATFQVDELAVLGEREH